MSWSRSWQDAIETTVRGLGYELVDAERSAGGLLRVMIDHAAPAGAASDPSTSVDERAVTVDDCEKVTRQLQHVLEVEGVDYQRLEVSSPGLDRPLKRAADYARFSGRQVDLTLKLPFNGRKRWRGELQGHGDGWRLVLPAEGGAAPQALDFALGEVREARLVPVIDFKGRRGRAPAAEGAPEAGAPSAARGRAGGRKARSAPAQAAAAAEVDGGRIR